MTPTMCTHYLVPYSNDFFSFLMTCMWYVLPVSDGSNERVRNQLHKCLRRVEDPQFRGFVLQVLLVHAMGFAGLLRYGHRRRGVLVNNYVVVGSVVWFAILKRLLTFGRNWEQYKTIIKLYNWLVELSYEQLFSVVYLNNLCNIPTFLSQWNSRAVGFIILSRDCSWFK